MYNDIVETIKDNYQLRVEKNPFNVISTTLNNKNRTILLAQQEFVLPTGIYNKMDKSDILLVDYYKESNLFSAILKRKNANYQTVLGINDSDCYSALCSISTYINFENETSLDKILEVLKEDGSIYFIGGRIGYTYNNKIIKLSKQEERLFKIFSRINYKLNNEKTIVMKVTKNQEDYVISLIDCNQNTGKKLVYSSDLLDGLLAIDRNISSQKGKIFSKKIR